MFFLFAVFVGKLSPVNETRVGYKSSRTEVVLKPYFDGKVRQALRSKE